MTTFAHGLGIDPTASASYGSPLSAPRLAQLARELRSTDVLSVYLQCERSAEDRRYSRTRLLAAFQLVQLEHRDDPLAQRVALAHCITALGDSLLSHAPRIREQALVAFVTGTGIQHVGRLPGVARTRAFWGNGLRLAPYVCAASWSSAAKIFVVGKRQADEYEYANHSLRHTEHIDGCRSSRRLNRIGPFGITPLDELEPALATERDYSTRPETLRVCSLVSNRIRNQATASCCVILVGCEPEVKRVLAAVPAHVACRVCIDEQQATRQRHSERSLAELCERHLERYDGERQHALLEEFFSPREGALGIRAVTRSLSQDRVRCLLYTPRFSREAEDVLEHVMQCALDQDAQIEMLSGTDADRLDAMGGVGATLLRRESMALPI